MIFNNFRTLPKMVLVSNYIFLFWMVLGHGVLFRNQSKFRNFGLLNVRKIGLNNKKKKRKKRKENNIYTFTNITKIYFLSRTK